MKSSILILAVAALAFSSCTSAYKTGQTPDDVYFSPARPAGSDEYVQVEKKDDRQYRGSDEYYEDRYLRMRVQNRYRWSPLDDYYMNSPYAYNYSFYGNYNAWSNPYNNYWCWNNYYNPYYSGVVVVKNPKTSIPPPSRPVVFNSNSYNPGNNSRPAGNRISNSYNNGSRYNNSNSNSFGNTLRKVFTNSSNNNSNSYQSNNSSGSSSTPSRSYNPSSSSSSSSSGRSSSSSSSSGSSSGGSSGSTSRPAR